MDMTARMTCAERNQREKERRLLEWTEKKKAAATKPIVPILPLETLSKPTIARKQSPCAKCGKGCVVQMCPRWEKWFRGRWQAVRETYGQGNELPIQE